jgi:hypothetical protein
MTRDEALAILDLERDQAVAIILALAEKAEKYDRLGSGPSPTTPSGMTPTYLKPAHKKRNQSPGRGEGHPGAARQRPLRIDEYQEHTLEHCPQAAGPYSSSSSLPHRSSLFLAPLSPDPDAQRLRKRLKRHQKELFTFLEYPEVSPYNNHAEQQMRKPVLTRKVSQQNRSENGSKTQAILMSLFRSAELQKCNPVEFVLQMAKASLLAKIPEDMTNSQLILFSKS